MRLFTRLATLAALITGISAAYAEAPQPSPAVTPAALPQPKVIKREAPVYPRHAAEAGEPGQAELRLTIDAAGNATEITVLREAPEGYGFGKEAKANAEKWVFAPGAPGEYGLNIKFRLQDYDLIEPPNPALPAAPAVVDWSRPKYPRMAVELGITGTAHLVIKLDEDGKVKQAGVIGFGDPFKDQDGAGLFGGPVLEALAQMRFEPNKPGLYQFDVEFSPQRLKDGWLR